MDGRFISGVAAQKVLNVCGHTLRVWDNQGKIKTIRTPGGQRRYDISSIVGSNATIPDISEQPRKRTGVCYARVSSRGQRDDLDRQVEYLRAKFPDHRIVTDVASGINWKRKGLKTVLELAKQGDISEVVVAARDRLCRFAFELVEHVLSMHGVRTIVLDSEGMSPEQELSDDLLSIVQIFCCRRNGRRRYSSAQEAVENEEDKTEPDG